MQFSLFAALALAPLALAFGPGYYKAPAHAIIARDISGLKADLYALERRFAEASFEDEDDSFTLSARSTFDEDEYLDMLLRRAFPATPTGGQGTRGPQQISASNINRVNTKLGQFRNGSEGHTTQDKQNEIERLASQREAGRTNTNRHYG
ncbi:hypothetical protein MMC32_005901 [Xylographa parallela]|nr:hypothetical protein [Xylographa parallela]